MRYSISIVCVRVWINICKSAYLKLFKHRYILTAACLSLVFCLLKNRRVYKVIQKEFCEPISKYIRSLLYIKYYFIGGFKGSP